jgi:hypothetical protein
MTPDSVRREEHKGVAVNLTIALDEKQAAQRLESMDRQLLAGAEQFRQLVEGLPDEPKP